MYHFIIKGGVGKISHFLPLSVNISKTVPDTILSVAEMYGESNKKLKVVV